MGKEYRDEEWLHKQYVDEAKPMQEIADMCGCALGTIDRWIGKHDLPRRTRSESLRLAHGTNDGKYNDPEWLYEQYVENERSGLDLSDECDVHVDTIYKRLDEHGIKRRTVKEATNTSDKMGFEGRDHPAWNESDVSFYTHGRDNYECWSHNWNNEKHSVYVHRLLAVAEYGFDAVKDKHVHHINGIRWDNRPDNIDPVTHEEHIKIHKERGDYSKV